MFGILLQMLNTLVNIVLYFYKLSAFKKGQLKWNFIAMIGLNLKFKLHPKYILSLKL